MTFRVVNGSTHSENGWRLCDRNECEIVQGPYMDTAPLRKGAPAIILGEFVRRYHVKVAPVISPVWGWSLHNDVLGGYGKNNGSNHLAATAVDINAPQWPWGTKRMPPDLIARINALMREFEIDGQSGILHGRVWSKPDEMHFQLRWREGDPRNDRLVEKLLGKSPLRRPVVPGSNGTFWADVSQYQEKPIDSSYASKVFSFRTNSGDKTDSLAMENATAALSMLKSGGLEIVIPYYFFRPGQANCDLHREILESAKLFNHPRTVTMVDVEGDNGTVTGDNSWEINDEIDRIRGWYNSFERVIGYYNSNADPNLWPKRNGINLVVPQYYRTPGDISSILNSSVRSDAIAHQFTDKATNVAPWTGRNVDHNWSPYTVNELLVLFGMERPMADYPPVEQMIRELYDQFIRIPWFDGHWPSRGIFRDSNDGVDKGVGMILNTDGNTWDIKVLLSAILGDPKMLDRIRRVADGESPNGENKEVMEYAQSILKTLEGSEDENA